MWCRARYWYHSSILGLSSVNAQYVSARPRWFTRVLALSQCDLLSPSGLCAPFAQVGITLLAGESAPQEVSRSSRARGAGLLFVWNVVGEDRAAKGQGSL